jgi:hypothetical protein
LSSGRGEREILGVAMVFFYNKGMQEGEVSPTLRSAPYATPSAGTGPRNAPDHRHGTQDMDHGLGRRGNSERGMVPDPCRVSRFAEGRPLQPDPPTMDLSHRLEATA